MTTPRIAVVTPSAGVEERVAGLCPDIQGGVARIWSDSFFQDSPAMLAEQLAGTGADVVVIGPDVPTMEALALARALDHDHPAVSVVIAAAPYPALLEEALRAGVRDVIDLRTDDDKLEASLLRALKSADRLRMQLGSADQRPGAASRVIVVLAPKGGTGKTTVATNLAVGLARQHPNQVALVDFDLQFGDVATCLRLAPEQTILHSQLPGLHLDATTLKAFLTPHPCGLFVLCAPEQPAEAETLTTDHLHRALKLLAEDFPFVVVDTSAGIDDAALVAMDLATDVVLLTTTDVPSVRATRKQAEALIALQMTDRNWHVVLNRADARVGLDRQDIERTLGLSIDVAIPSSRLVPVSLNQGSPLVETEPKSRVARAMGELAARFEEPVVESKSATGSRRFSWRREL